MKISKLDEKEFSWLKDSDFYGSLDLDDPEEEITIDYCSINENDINLLLDISHLWGVNFYPVKFFTLLFKTLPEKKLKEFYELTHSKFHKFLLEIIKLDKVDRKHELCDKSVENGYLDCLIYAYRNRCFWYKGTCAIASKHGNLNCLKFLRENNCPWNEYTAFYAAGYDRLDCLKFCYENDCPLNKEIFVWSVGKGKMYSIENDLKEDEKATGSIECLKYLYLISQNSNFTWDEDTTACASYTGNLDGLVFAHENGCPLSRSACDFAAKNGHLLCLKYSHEQGCPWNERTCFLAANNGHLDVLIYLHENGCPWNGETSDVSAGNGYLDIFMKTVVPGTMKQVCLQQNI